MTPTTKELRKHLLASAIDAGAPADLMRRADAWLDKWQPVIEREAAAEAEALRAEAIATHEEALRLRVALDRSASALHAIGKHEGHVAFNPEQPGFRGCPMTVCQRATAALATPAPAAPVAATFDAGADAHAETYRKGWEASRAEAEALRAALEPLNLARIIRSVDPRHDLGAAALADAILAALATPAPAAPAEPER